MNGRHLTVYEFPSVWIMRIRSLSRSRKKDLVAVGMVSYMPPVVKPLMTSRCLPQLSFVFIQTGEMMEDSNVHFV